MKDQQRQRDALGPSCVAERLKLVVHGVPVVVTVDERDIERAHAAEDVQADVTVKDVSPPEAAGVFLGIELREWVDDVQLGIGTERVEHEGRRLAAQRADFHDAPGFRRLDQRSDDRLPEWKHLVARRGGIRGVSPAIDAFSHRKHPAPAWSRNGASAVACSDARRGVLVVALGQGQRVLLRPCERRRVARRSPIRHSFLRDGPLRH
jgi:hypothetical protein